VSDMREFIVSTHFQRLVIVVALDHNRRDLSCARDGKLVSCGWFISVDPGPQLGRAVCSIAKARAH
jgi:hypothetical protein